MAFLVLGLLGLTSLGSLICWIIVLIKLFQQEGAGLGILGLFCGIYTFYWGWQNADRQNIRTVMTIWSICFGIGLVVNLVARTM